MPWMIDLRLTIDAHSRAQAEARAHELANLLADGPPYLIEVEWEESEILCTEKGIDALSDRELHHAG